MSNVTTHSGTAILINEGHTAYVCGRGFYRSCALEPDRNVYHVEIEDSYKAIAKSCEILDDDYISIFGEGKFVIYAREISEEELDKQYEDAIYDFIDKHAFATCTVDEWDHFSDIYKDLRGFRPRPSQYNITVK